MIDEKSCINSLNKSKSNKNNKENLVNGPVNAIRLEGQINGVNKIVYLFADCHQSISNETKCDSFVSIDFVKFFYETMEKTNKEINFDFFFENYSNVDMFEQYKYSNYAHREKYLDEIRKYVDSDMNMNRHAENKGAIYENIGSKSFKNLKLHYLDIRSFLGANILDPIENNIAYYFNNFDKDYEFWMIDKLLINLYEYRYLIVMLYDEICDAIKIKKKSYKFLKIDENIISDTKISIENMGEQKPRINKYINKIFKKYKNNDVKDKLLNSKIFNNIITNIQHVIKELNICIKKSLKLKEISKVSKFGLNKANNEEYIYGCDYQLLNKIFYILKKKYSILNYERVRIFVNLTDIYLLRRLLDKEYINHSIVYTGSWHTGNYIHTLLNYFNFTITHMDYSKFDLRDTNKIILEKEPKDLGELVMKPILKQCVDMSKFPKNFE